MQAVNCCHLSILINNTVQCTYNKDHIVRSSKVKLPAAVDINDIIFLGECRSLKAVSQRTIKNPNARNTRIKRDADTTDMVIGDGGNLACTPRAVVVRHFLHVGSWISIAGIQIKTTVRVVVRLNVRIAPFQTCSEQETPKNLTQKT